MIRCNGGSAGRHIEFLSIDDNLAAAQVQCVSQQPNDHAIPQSAQVPIGLTFFSGQLASPVTAQDNFIPMSIEQRLCNAPVEVMHHVRTGAEELVRYNMEHVRARVCAILDISGSMEQPNKFVSTGVLQNLFNQFFSLAILFDDNQEIEVFLLGATAGYQTIYRINQNNFNNFVDWVILQVGYAKETNYVAPIQKVLSYYFSTPPAEWLHNDPVFCAFLTDGAPNPSESGRLAKREIAKTAQNGAPIFFKFLALHGQDRDFKLLEEIDNDKSRCFDNTDFAPVENPALLTMRDIINEFGGFIKEAHARKLLDTDYGVPTGCINAEGRMKAADYDDCSNCKCVIQ